jgi:hypothetical protein
MLFRLTADYRQDRIFHRAPCHTCSLCDGDQCAVVKFEPAFDEVHLCAAGCDGPSFDSLLSYGDALVLAEPDSAVTAAQSGRAPAERAA